MLHPSSGYGISVDSVPGIELDSHSSVHTIFVLVIINAMINLKQLGPVVLICVEINWVGS